jgi:hypothetical protein
MTSPGAAAAEDRPRRSLYTRFQKVLRDPAIVEEATDRAMRGEDVHADERFGGRFEREPERQAVLPGR